MMANASRHSKAGRDVDLQNAQSWRINNYAIPLAHPPLQLSTHTTWTGCPCIAHKLQLVFAGTCRFVCLLFCERLDVESLTTNILLVQAGNGNTDTFWTQAQIDNFHAISASVGL